MKVINHVVSSKSNNRRNTTTVTRNAKAQHKAKAPKGKKSKAKDAPKSSGSGGFWKTVSGEHARQIYGVILMTFAILLIISIISFYLNAHNNITYVNGDHDAVSPKNAAHGLGAYLSYFFVTQLFGVVSIGFPVLFFLYGLALTFKLHPLPLFKTTLNMLVTMSWLSLVLGMFFRNGKNTFIAGAFGNYAAEGLMHLGTIVAVLAIIALLAIILIIFYRPFVLALKDFSVASFDQLQQSIVNLNQNDPDAEVASERRNRRNKKGKDDKVTDEPSTHEDLDDLYISDHGCLSKEYDNKTHIWEIEQEQPNFKSPSPVAIATPESEEVPFEVVSQNATDDIPAQNDDEDELVDAEAEEGEDPRQLTPEEVHNLPPYDPRAELSTYDFPPIDLLNDYPSKEANEELMKHELLDNKKRIESTLNSFSIPIRRITATVGPTVTLYEIVPAEGVRISKIKNLEDDIALSLAALGIRIIAPIPGRGTIGIEVPNKNPNIVSMKEIITSDKFQNNSYALPIGLGRTISNEPFVVDLAKMPHLLVAGATGQGKSVGLNAIITSLLYTKHPCEMKFVLIDPKKVEFTLYSAIENYYLASLPDNGDAIITDTKKVVRTLNSLCKEMDDRYDLLKLAKMRNIKEYNAKFCARELSPAMGHRYLPYIVLVIDEFGDLIMTAGREVEQPLARLAQLARAIGIHLVIATQRPSVNIITGSIKANFPARIAFRVQSSIDSRTILDTTGANQLIGKGDMLISTGSDIVRLQCAFVDTPEVEKIATYIEEKAELSPLREPYELPDVPEPGTEMGKDDFDSEPSSGEIDPFFVDAAVLIVQTQQGSTSQIQRRMKLGYNRSGRIMDQLEEFGIVGPGRGSKPREVLVKTEAQLRQLLAEKGML
ncbi:MAG: DNA translocase FtsK 4TM domain-containing protein [Bacteroidales bacterium]|nr:DNA translocase FtsK 4TM domain-containing protein [Bacteroidales bacterium]